MASRQIALIAPGQQLPPAPVQMRGRLTKCGLALGVMLAIACAPISNLASVLAGGAMVQEAGASTPQVSVNRGSVSAQNEYFATSWQDAMDFSNPEDFDVTPGHMVMQGNSNLAYGQLNLSGAQQVFLLRSDPGSYPTTAIRDPRSRPLDANKYRRTTFRMYSDRASNAAMFFRQCNSCADGLKYFQIRAGWHTYDLDMTGPWDFDGLPGASLPPVRGAAWAGNIEMMWMITSFDAGNLPNVSMDDFGLIAPTEDIGVTIPATNGPAELWMDLDNNQGNDGSANAAGPSASLIGTVNGPTTVGLPSGLLHRGQTARFYTAQGSQRSAASAPVSMSATSTPSPRMLTPWEGAGDDWATVWRGDPWNFDQASDSWAVNAATANVWGALHGWTAGGAANDPVVVLNQNKLIDGQMFHKVAITINYEGGWGLQDGPGGGMVGRIVWHPYGGNSRATQVSDDIVLRTGRATYYVEMRTWPPTQILDPAGNGDPIGWGTGRSTWIEGLEFHPHEDPGPRSWQLEDVKLLRNDYVDLTKGGYDVKFLDDAWAPGTTATIIADPNLDPNDPAQVVIASGLAVQPGINTFRWNGWPVAPGSYYLRVVLDRGGRQGTSYSFGQVDYGPAPAPWPPERANGLVK